MGTQLDHRRRAGSLTLLGLALALALLAVPQQATAVGSPCFVSSAASTNGTRCTQGTTKITGLRLINTTSALYYLHLYNLAGTPPCASATGFIETIPVPHNTGAGGGIADSIEPSTQTPYIVGMGFCLTGAIDPTSSTVAATGVTVSIRYEQ